MVRGRWALGSGAGTAGFSLSLALWVALLSCSPKFSVTSVLSRSVACIRTVGGAFGASAPVDDLGLVDPVAGVVGGRQAGGVTDGAVHVDDGAARPADEVVVVVADPSLVPRDRTRGLDAADETYVGEGAQHVVDGLVRHVAVRAGGLPDRVGVGVRVVVHRPEHREPRARHAEGGAAQHRCELRLGRHAWSLVPFLERIKSREDAHP